MVPLHKTATPLAHKKERLCEVSLRLRPGSELRPGNRKVKLGPMKQELGTAGHSRAKSQSQDSPQVMSIVKTSCNKGKEEVLQGEQSIK